MELEEIITRLQEADERLISPRITAVKNMVLSIPERRLEIILEAFIETEKSLRESEKQRLYLMQNSVVPLKISGDI